jgi:hypothetical protein
MTAAPESTRDAHIRKVIVLCNEMLTIAQAGERTQVDQDGAVFFAALRDCAYRIRRLAKNELIRLTN